MGWGGRGRESWLVLEGLSLTRYPWGLKPLLGVVESGDGPGFKALRCVKN